MKILAIDSSGLVASVAIVEDDILVAEYNIQHKITHSQTLLPMLDHIREKIELDLATIDAIAIAKGPGSFTGLRIGSATVKGLGLVLDVPVIEIPTVDGIAYNMYGSNRLICPIMDARRSQVYTGLYSFEKCDKQADDMDGGSVGYQMKVEKEQYIAIIDELVDEINAMGREVVFLGDGVPVYADRIRDRICVDYEFAPPMMNRQRAAVLATMARAYLLAGKTVSADEHAPDYLRLSQAERERLEKEQ